MDEREDSDPGSRAAGGASTSIVSTKIVRHPQTRSLTTKNGPYAPYFPCSAFIASYSMGCMPFGRSSSGFFTLDAASVPTARTTTVAPCATTRARIIFCDSAACGGERDGAAPGESARTRRARLALLEGVEPREQAGERRHAADGHQRVFLCAARREVRGCGGRARTLGAAPALLLNFAKKSIALRRCAQATARDATRGRREALDERRSRAAAAVTRHHSTSWSKMLRQDQPFAAGMGGAFGAC